MKLVALETMQGESFWLNVDHVVGLGPMRSKDGVPIIGQTLIQLIAGQMVVKGSPHELVAVIEKGSTE